MKEIFRQDAFDRAAFDRVTRFIDELELGAVDYRVLKNRRGYVDFLADLVNRELRANEIQSYVPPPGCISTNSQFAR